MEQQTKARVEIPSCIRSTIDVTAYTCGYYEAALESVAAGLYGKEEAAQAIRKMAALRAAFEQRESTKG